MWGQYSTQIIALVAVTVIGVGTVTYRILEDWSWVDSVYFSVITLTSVGYGDLAPTSDAAKLFTVLYVVDDSVETHRAREESLTTSAQYISSTKVWSTIGGRM